MVLCQHRGEEIPRYAVLGEMTATFVAAVLKYAVDHQVPIVQFERGQRNEAVAQPYFEAFDNRCAATGTALASNQSDESVQSLFAHRENLVSDGTAEVEEPGGRLAPLEPTVLLPITVYVIPSSGSCQTTQPVPRSRRIDHHPQDVVTGAAIHELLPGIGAL